MNNMQTVILCGGKGLRLGGQGLPKSLFLIGEKPILWHIMRLYSFYGFNDFILCLGYQQDKIRKYFKNSKTWKTTFVDTGLDTNTGGRIARIKRYIKGEHFLATYGDGVADINLKKPLQFHKKHKKTATITVVKPCSPFGIAGVDSKTQVVTHFEEKPILDHWINGGFFVFSREIFNFLKTRDCLERDTFRRLAKYRECVAYKHHGFWQCMDTYKDHLKLNELWAKKRAPWAVWQEK
jgi:glucose-1-phosphate cytidylyltransferase